MRRESKHLESLKRMGGGGRLQPLTARCLLLPDDLSKAAGAPRKPVGSQARETQTAGLRGQRRVKWGARCKETKKAP